MSLSTVSISLLLMKPRLTPRSKRKLVDLSAFKEPPYLLFVLAVSFGFIGFLVPSFYLGTVAHATGIVSAPSSTPPAPSAVSHLPF
jgi:hypothetical protein